MNPHQPSHPLSDQVETLARIIRQAEAELARLRGEVNKLAADAATAAVEAAEWRAENAALRIERDRLQTEIAGLATRNETPEETGDRSVLTRMRSLERKIDEIATMLAPLTA